MGAYTAFLDMALGLGTPALGFLSDHAGLGTVFGGSMLAALGAGGITTVLLNRSRARSARCALACP